MTVFVHNFASPTSSDSHSLPFAIIDFGSLAQLVRVFSSFIWDMLFSFMVLEGTPRFAGCVVLTRLEGRRDIKGLDQA